MKILLANKFFYLKGGSEKVFFQERDFLIRQGVAVVDFAMQDPGNLPSSFSAFFPQAIDFQNTNGLIDKLYKTGRFIHSAEAVRKIKELVVQEKPQLAHLHNIYHQFTPSIIHQLKKEQVKVVMTLHDGKLICPSYTMLNKGLPCTACQGKYFFKPLFMHCQASYGKELLLTLEANWHKWQQSYEQVDLFLAPSQFLAQLVSLRIPPEKIRVLVNGIDLEDVKPRCLPGAYALYVGRLSKEKGLVTLIKAHSLLKGKVPLKIVGRGPLQDGLMALSSELLAGGEQAPEFLGYKSGAELTALIQQAAFIIVPSEWYENCSMVVLEAMVNGKPVIGSRVGGIPEQITDGKTGLLFGMGDSEELAARMETLMQDEPLRIRMGQAARQSAEDKYALTKHCQNLLTIYEELLKK